MLQTWLPYPNYRVSAHVLDSKTLGQQLADCVTILSILSGEIRGGSNRYHRTTLLWAKYQGSLVLYTDAVVRELHIRGYQLGMPSPRSARGADFWKLDKSWTRGTPQPPDWLGTERLHASHRATLLARDPAWYVQMDWDERAAHRPEWPLPVPGPGDDVIGPEGQLGMVHSVGRAHVRIVRSGVLEDVPRELFREGTWRRCQVRRD